MKHKFVVDENIYYCALRCIDEYNKMDKSSANFLTNLHENCRHKICMDREYNHRFERYLRSELENIQKKEPISTVIVKVFNNLLYTQGKIKRDYPYPSVFPGENSIPPDDLYIARCANHFSAKVVTLDGDLKDAINANPFLKEKGIEALRPEDAIPLVLEK